MAYLYGYFSPDDLEGINIKQLIPSLQLPVEGKPLEKVKYMFMYTLIRNSPKLLAFFKIFWIFVYYSKNG